MASRDGVEWFMVITQCVSGLCALAAVIYAAITVRRGDRNARGAQALMEHERAIAFQLSVLRDLGEMNLAKDRSGGQISRLMLLAAMLPIEMIPITRVLAGLHTTFEAAQLRDDTADRLKADPRTDFSGYPVWDALKTAVEEELLAAVEGLVGVDVSSEAVRPPFRPRPAVGESVARADAVSR